MHLSKYFLAKRLIRFWSNLRSKIKKKTFVNWMILYFLWLLISVASEASGAKTSFILTPKKVTSVCFFSFFVYLQFVSTDQTPDPVLITFAASFLGSTTCFFPRKTDRIVFESIKVHENFHNFQKIVHYIEPKVLNIFNTFLQMCKSYSSSFQTCLRFCDIFSTII